MDEVINYFKNNNVKCKKVEDKYGNFIAIFGYGNLTRQAITEQIERNNLLCMFFESNIRKEEHEKKHALTNLSGSTV